MLIILTLALITATVLFELPKAMSMSNTNFSFLKDVAATKSSAAHIDVIHKSTESNNVERLQLP